MKEYVRDLEITAGTITVEGENRGHLHIIFEAKSGRKYEFYTKDNMITNYKMPGKSVKSYENEEN